MLSIFFLLFVADACHRNEESFMKFQEVQLTQSPQGHTLHNTQVFSEDGQWVVYDTRNDDTKIGSTSTIEMANVRTGEIKPLYHTEHQTIYGPGVGAATFSPTKGRVLFIHGIRNADSTNPYSATRRTGVSIDIDRPGHPIFMDARDITPPFTPGALRGGTHAHSWSGDGKWISFTYNDYVLEQLAKIDASVQDLRMVGIMVPKPVTVASDSSMENNSGAYFSVIVTHVTENPEPGSDAIDKAFDECWIGKNGYRKPDGSRQRRAIAFQGNVRNTAGKSITEIFVVDLPDELTAETDGQPVEGTATLRPGVPKSIVQRRITHLTYGIEGPRHWLRTTPDGALICYLAKDEEGIIQLFGISPNGGTPRSITQNRFPVQGPFNIDPSGTWIAYPADNSLFITEIATGITERITPRFTDLEKPIGAPNWSPDGKTLAYNRYIDQDNDRFLQIFLLRK
ncbi:DUF3748 domain-containing protein [Parapedobacter indicus]|nr:DUF3748 domain-containing protein [Parapedobacter indicus]